MDICFVNPRLYYYLDPQSDEVAGGAQRQIYLLSQQLLKRGHDVSAIIGDYGQPHRYRYQDVDTVAACPTSTPQLSGLVGDFYRLQQAISKIDADVYYVRGAPRLFLATRVATAICRSNLVYGIANESDLDEEYLLSRYGRIFYELYTRMIGMTDAVGAQTIRQQEILRESYNVDSTHVPNGYPLPPSSEIQPHTDRDHILWVGRSNEEKKRPDIFLDLAEQLPQIPIIMISRPDHDDEYHKWIASRARKLSNVVFHERIDSDKIHERFRSAALLVNTSSYEGFPNTYLEAWRYETPVVSLSFAPADDVVERGLCQPAGSLDALADEVESLWHHPGNRAQIGHRCRRHMRSQYSMDEVTNSFLTLMDEATNSYPIEMQCSNCGAKLTENADGSTTCISCEYGPEEIH
ncbi:glycosyltransferase family 4 protein [Haloarcula japonica]|uniref:glycosyltransferase family 4 protein n=1 Tax=Haloarcula japonica TaxID=29282 RepID=UPI0039F6B258